MKNFKFLFFLSFVFMLFSCSNSNKDPKEVAENFYNAINTGDYKLALEYSDNNAKEEIGRIEKIQTTSENLPYEYVQTITKGDHVEVVYKVGKRKETIDMIYDSEKSLKVVSGALPIRKIKLTSFELYNLQIGGKKYDRMDKEIKLRLEKDLKGLRFEIHDLLLFKYESGDDLAIGLAYNKQDNFSPTPGCCNFEDYRLDFDVPNTFCHDLFLAGKKVSLGKNEYRGKQFGLMEAECFSFNFVDNSELIDVQKNKEMEKHENIIDGGFQYTVPKSFSFNRTFNIEGRFRDVNVGLDETLSEGQYRNGVDGGIVWMDGSSVHYSEPVRISFSFCHLVD
jgi:hypothetical protein